MSAPEYTLDELKAARDIKMKGDQESLGAPNELLTRMTCASTIAIKKSTRTL